MYNRRSVRVVALASIASLAMVIGAHAQTTEQCTAAVAEASALIDAPQNSNAPARNEAEQLRLQANNAGDQGRFQECIELATQAKAAMERM